MAAYPHKHHLTHGSYFLCFPLCILLTRAAAAPGWARRHCDAGARHVTAATARPAHHAWQGQHCQPPVQEEWMGTLATAMCTECMCHVSLLFQTPWPFVVNLGPSLFLNSSLWLPLRFLLFFFRFAFGRRGAGKLQKRGCSHRMLHRRQDNFGPGKKSCIQSSHRFR